MHGSALLAEESEIMHVSFSTRPGRALDFLLSEWVMGVAVRVRTTGVI
jgi:hypothetical protein